MLYKIKNNSIDSTKKIKFSEENISEKNIENWVEKHPEMLGEPLKIIARQLKIQEVGDRLDLLALDKQGNLVIIELKSDVIKSDATLQAVKYASYLSDWEFDEIEKQMYSYTDNAINNYDVLAEIENFCEEDYEINDNQRVIIAGRKVRPRTSSIALWLRKQGVNIKIVRFEPWKDGKDIYLHPKILIPLPAEEKFHISVTGDKSQPWKSEGKKWHLNNRCSEKSAELLKTFINMVKENFPKVEGPSWNQKFYVTLKINGSNWIYIRTQNKNLRIQVNCVLDHFDIEEIAQKLNLESLEKDTSFKSKRLDNQVKKWTAKSRIVFRITTDYEFENEFIEILKKLKNSYEEYRL